MHGNEHATGVLTLKFEALSFKTPWSMNREVAVSVLENTIMYRALDNATTATGNTGHYALGLVVMINWLRQATLTL